MPYRTTLESMDATFLLVIEIISSSWSSRGKKENLVESGYLIGKFWRFCWKSHNDSCS